MYEWFLVIAIWLQPLGVESGEPPSEVHPFERRTSETDCNGVREEYKREFPELHNSMFRFACMGVPIKVQL